MQKSQAVLTATNNTAFKQRLTIMAEGVSTNVSDRTFSGVVTAKPGGMKLADIEVKPRDQNIYPGQVDLYIPFVVMRKIPLNPQSAGFRFPTVFAYDLTCTYLSDPAKDPESVISGPFYVYSGA